MKKRSKAIISVVAGGVLGYLLYYYFFIEVLAIFFTSGFFYVIVSLAFLAMSIVGCISLLYVILSGYVHRWMFILLTAAYFVAMAIILFARSTIGHIAILNPLVGLADLKDSEMVVQSALNLITFIPLGYFFRNKSFWKTLCSSAVIAITIEMIQYLTMRGMLDTFDMILYVLGIVVGAWVFRHISLKIQ